MAFVHFLGAAALTVMIFGGGLAALRAVGSSMAAKIPASTRARARILAGKPPKGKQQQQARHDPWAHARATDWLERRRAWRDRAPQRREARAALRRNTGSAWNALRSRTSRPAVLSGGTAGRETQAAAAAAPPPQPVPPSAPPEPWPQPGRPALSLVPPANPAPQPAAAGRPPMPGRYGVPADWSALVARVANFEPENEAELLRLLAAEAAGHQAYADAIEHMYEHLLSKIGLDPAAIAGVHECAEAATEDAARWTTAEGLFQQRYQGVMEFASSGGVLPYEGRFITGEGA